MPVRRSYLNNPADGHGPDKKPTNAHGQGNHMILTVNIEWSAKGLSNAFTMVLKLKGKYVRFHRESQNHHRLDVPQIALLHWSYAAAAPPDVKRPSPPLLDRYSFNGRKRSMLSPITAISLIESFCETKY